MSHEGKMKGDIAWNVASLAILGVSGICQNLVILRYYDTSVLGAFNQVFALYIFFSQFAVGGIHLSVLKHVSEHIGDGDKVRSIVCSGLVPTFVFSAIAAMLFVVVRDPAAHMLESPDVATGMLFAAPGLFLFSLNKVLLNVVNAEQRMKLFAMLQALRPISYLASILVMASSHQPGGMLPMMFTIGEGILFLSLVVAVFPRLCGSVKAVRRSWMKKHVSFGGRACLSGVLGELNTRVDVLMLGLFLSDRWVGIYSFGAIIAEGFFQLLVILRNHFNPVLVPMLADPDRTRLEEFIRRGRNRTWLWIGVTGLVSILCYPLVLDLLAMVGVDGVHESAGVFGWIVLGIVLAAGYLPFSQMLINAGRPGTHTLYILSVVIFNVLANLLLIPQMGIVGAAIATGLAYVYSGVALKVLCSSLLRLRL